MIGANVNTFFKKIDCKCHLKKICDFNLLRPPLCSSKFEKRMLYILKKKKFMHNVCDDLLAVLCKVF